MLIFLNFSLGLDFNVGCAKKTTKESLSKDVDYQLFPTQNRRQSYDVLPD